MIAEILKIIERYDFGSCIRWILENNPSQALPYHNFSHSLWVAYYVDQAYRYEKPDSDTPRELIIAALFHDFDHGSGFFLDDGENIERALMGLNGFALADAMPEDVFAAQFLVVETKYPFTPIVLHEKDVRNSDEYRFQVSCLRDADMLQNCNDTLLANFVGIKQELFRYDS